MKQRQEVTDVLVCNVYLLSNMFWFVKPFLVGLAHTWHDLKLKHNSLGEMDGFV